MKVCLAGSLESDRRSASLRLHRLPVVVGTTNDEHHPRIAPSSYRGVETAMRKTAAIVQVNSRRLHFDDNALV